MLTTVVHYTNVWFSIDTSCPPRSTICLEKKTRTTPSYTEQFQDGRPRFDKCIRYFIDLQNCITTEKNFQNVRALDRKILHYSRFEAYGILFYLSHQCISWVRIWIRFDMSIFSFIMSWDESIAKYIDQSGAGGISAITGSSNFNIRHVYAYIRP